MKKILLLAGAAALVLAASATFVGLQEQQAAADTGTQMEGAPFTIEEIVRDGDRALLRVRNRTPFMVIMHIGGVRVGWMRPYRTGLLRGLAPGYHKLYAHSRFGSMSWGPREIWVPGTWNLLY